MRNAVAVLACLLALGMGCGERPRRAPLVVPPSTSASATVEGRVVLPAGSVIAPASLQVSTEAGEAPIARDGAFRAAVPATGQAPIFLVRRVGTEEVVFMGTRTSLVVGSASTATALLFYATGAFAEDAETWDAWLHLIALEDATARLARAIDATLARSASPLSDPLVTAAMKEAAAELVNGPAAR